MPMPNTTLDEYQNAAVGLAVYPPGIGLIYCTIKQGGESGEFSEKVGKGLRNGQIRIIPGAGNQVYMSMDPALRKPLALELGDNLWYIAALAKELGFTLEEIATMNLDKLNGRKERSTLVGEGDNR